MTLFSDGEPRLIAGRVPVYPGSPGRFAPGAIDFAAIPAPSVGDRRTRLAAVLFDRDGTLVRDVPYNADPALVEPMPFAREALELVRRRGIRVGVVTNQSGIGRGRLTASDVARVHARVEELLGPFDVWQVCPHAPDDGCGCRKPAPGLVTAAARELGVDVRDCAVIGDIGSDLAAATAAGARSVLVPTPVTRPEEVAMADTTAPDLLRAVTLLVEAA